MLGALLLLGLIAAPIGSAALFLRARPRTRLRARSQARSQAGPWPTSRRFILALIGTAALAGVAAAFLVFLLAGALNLAAGDGDLFRKLTVFLVATVPVLFILGLVRAIALLRRGTGASWRDAFGAFFIWQSTSLVVAVGSAARQLGGIRARDCRTAGNRGGVDQAGPAQRAAARRTAGAPDRRPRGRARQ